MTFKVMRVVDYGDDVYKFSVTSSSGTAYEADVVKLNDEYKCSFDLAAVSPSYVEFLTRASTKEALTATVENFFEKYNKK